MAELLKISEVAARAGVPKATIAYYVREGLLPPPARKTHRNMAYYSADFVERVKLIKTLQTERFLPLSVIKKMLAGKRGVAEMRAFIDSRPLAPPVEAPVPTARKALLAASGLTPGDLAALRKAGLIANERRARFDAAESAVIRAVGSLKKMGLDSAHGFHADALRIYRESMEALARKEFSLFLSQVPAKHAGKDLLPIAQAAFEASSALLLSLRRKVLLEMLAESRPPARRRKRA